MHKCFAALALALVAGWATARADTTGSVTGKIEDAGTGATVANVDVIAESFSQRTLTTTNERGWYAILDLPPGNYQIVLSKRGYWTTVIRGVQIAAGCQSTVNLALEMAMQWLAPNYPRKRGSFAVYRGDCGSYTVTQASNPFFDTATRIQTLTQFVPGMPPSAGPP